MSADERTSLQDDMMRTHDTAVADPVLMHSATLAGDSQTVAVGSAITAVHGSQREAAPLPYRVLIVEDDRSQALFAQSVLHGAGMQAQVQMQSDGVLDAIGQFGPDLVLMDLHMPGRDGMNLTLKIRQQPQYVHLPIVFLTGNVDPERRYEVLDSGADDFLIKPIRPRHLIAAVSNRILRARLHAPAAQVVPVETRLSSRAFMSQQLTMALHDRSVGGLFLVDVGGVPGLRERYGYACFERLMAQAGQRLAQAANPHLLTRLSDNNFLVLASGLAPEALQAFASNLRDSLDRETFQVREQEVLRLHGVVGYTALPQDFADGSSALEAVEHAVPLARQQPGNIAACMPPAAEQPLAATPDRAVRLSGVDFIQGNLARDAGSELDFDNGAA